MPKTFNRSFIALTLFVSVMAVSASVCVFSDGLSPGHQHEYVLNMIAPAEVPSLFVTEHPQQAAIAYCAPPVISEGVLKDVDPRCNSPG
jgi:hypothetical protein